MTLYLSRLRLKRDPATEALRARIDPDGPSARRPSPADLDAFRRSIRPQARFPLARGWAGAVPCAVGAPPAPAPLFEPP